jgi:hypothetical protein
MTAFFTALQKDPLSPPPLIDGALTAGDVQSMFKRAKECTSSDSGTLNYTIWKCLATDDIIAGIMSVLFSLPFLYGFVNQHWTSMTDFMLEKKPGVRHIHSLRIIGKVSAEFNTILKFLIGKKAMTNYENSSPHDEQHGFRPNRSSIDAALLKILTFDCAWLQKCTVGSIQHDMAAHFDRMYPAMTSLYASKYGIDDNVMLCINRTIEKLQRRVETSLGVSKASYGNTPGTVLLGGMVQGKADVPQWSTQQSDAMLSAFSNLAQGLHISSPSLGCAITHRNISFADDTDAQNSQPPGATDPIPAVVRDLQHGAKVWNCLVQICGGQLALHKCNWTLIAWEFIQGKLQMVSSTTERLIMADGNGSFATIEFLPPDQPNIGLGYRICPNGSQLPHYEATLSALTTLCRKCMSSHLTEDETRQLLRQRLRPKLVYAIHLSSFTQAQCGKINSVIRSTLIPRLRLNRHYPNALLYGPLEYGGMEMMDAYTLQDQVQLSYLLKQLRWDQTVANDILVTLDCLQLSSGLLRPVLEYPSLPILYVDEGFLSSVRRRLGEIDAGLWIEKAWAPSLQRVGDESLMSRFMSIPRITNTQLRRANIVRLFLRVFTIADLCDATGTYIPSGMLNGVWQAGSDLLWPHQPPPKSYFSTFRNCLRKTFCTKLPGDFYYNDSMELDVPLGPWLPVPRTTWFPVYCTKSELYWRKKDDSQLFVLVKSKVSGFYHYHHTTTILPLDSHPITFQQIGHDLWTQRPYRLASLPNSPELPAGHLVSNTLSNPRTEMIMVGCDGSVYLDQEVASCAWIIADEDEQTTSACFLLTNISSLSSYRSELEGIYHSLLHIRQLGITPREIQQWCDNESAVSDSKHPLITPTAMIKPDADVLLAIHHLRSHMERHCTIHCTHIYGHQDTR